MFVGHGFKIKPLKGGEVLKHPALGVGDILELQELFPENPVWQAETNDIGNIYHLTREEALEFYQALKDYITLEKPSSRKYISGNVTGGGFLVSSNLKSVFDDLILFFDKELGLVSVSDKKSTQ